MDCADILEAFILFAIDESEEVGPFKFDFVSKST
jgi:hypothetical protein